MKQSSVWWIRWGMFFWFICCFVFWLVALFLDPKLLSFVATLLVMGWMCDRVVMNMNIRGVLPQELVIKILQKRAWEFQDACLREIDVQRALSENKEPSLEKNLRGILKNTKRFVAKAKLDFWGAWHFFSQIGYDVNPLRRSLETENVSHKDFLPR